MITINTTTTKKPLTLQLDAKYCINGYCLKFDKTSTRFLLVEYENAEFQTLMDVREFTFEFMQEIVKDYGFTLLELI